MIRGSRLDRLPSNTFWINKRTFVFLIFPRVDMMVLPPLKGIALGVTGRMKRHPEGLGPAQGGANLAQEFARVLGHREQ